MRSHFTSIRVHCVLAAIVLNVSASTFAVQGRYFPDAPFILPNNVRVASYGNFVTQFNEPVQDTVKGIDAGSLQFDYNTWNQTGNPPPGGGGALTGGFFMSPGVTVKPGFSLHWIQLIGRDTATNGLNDWGYDVQAQNTPWPDADTPSPVYSYEALLPGINPNPAPTLGFTDFPARPFAWGSQTWQAELALTCTANNAGANGFTDVRVIGSFFWGFGLSTNPNNVVDRREPGFWGIPTNDFIDTMNEYYSGEAPGGQATGQFDFSNNSNCFQRVPEPASAVLCVLAIGLFVRRRMT